MSMTFEKGIKSKIKIFADDTSLFPLSTTPSFLFLNFNHDLDLISKWARQWKMSFNPDLTKPAEEVLFSVKRKSPHHTPLFYNGMEVKSA